MCGENSVCFYPAGCCCAEGVIVVCFCSLSGEAWCGFCFSEDCGWGSFLRIFLPLMFDHFRIVMFDTLLRKNWSWQALRCFCFSVSITLPETNTSPLKIGHPKRTIHLPTVDFQRQAVSFREGMLFWRIHDLTSENLRTALVKTHPLVIYIYPRHSRCDLLFFLNMESRWWLQLFFILISIWGRFPFWLILFRWVSNHQLVVRCLMVSIWLYSSSLS